MKGIQDLCSSILAECGIRIVGQVDIPPRERTVATPPTGLEPRVVAWIQQRFPGGIYVHQEEALKTSLDGNDVCLATATASGKSLVFMAAAANLALKDPNNKTLALYPARALIQDQVQKWDELLTPLGIPYGFIDGGVAMDRRQAILSGSGVVLMTPDVAHAWLLSHLSEPTIRGFLSSIRLLVLDEAHVYDGAFGTNMAYFLRRLQAAAANFQIVASTATVDDPAAFMRQLTGRSMVSFDRGHDTSAAAPKRVFLVEADGPKGFDAAASLLAELRDLWQGRFLAFSESRRAVEQLVAAASRGRRVAEGTALGDTLEEDDGEVDDGAATDPTLLPYRAGYETEDRQRIQESLRSGRLRGIVSTSALELGIDIGDVNLAVLLDVPSTMKAFWQRIGRAGRTQPAICLLFDSRLSLASAHISLEAYVRRPVEHSWLYLDNRYIQYANALCAAVELSDTGMAPSEVRAFQSLPPRFLELLQNELNPSEVVPQDLYSLKQRAQNGPQREFPIRSAADKNLQVSGPMGLQLGGLTYGQALREAFPGAIYYYMARPYRVIHFDLRKGEIRVKRERPASTRAVAQTTVFPRFLGGLLSLARNESGFLAEVEMQVSERVTGFTETRGASRSAHQYGVGSPYSQRPLSRFFETTGVCWSFNEKAANGEDVARALLGAFAIECGIQERDLGVGLFVAKESPFVQGKCQGVCVYDATNGSLRLTEKLFAAFGTILSTAVSQARPEADSSVLLRLQVLQRSAAGLADQVAATPEGCEQVGIRSQSDWATVIAPGQRAIYLMESGPQEVTVRGYRYTPQGLMYELEPPTPDVKWVASANVVKPLNGESTLIRVNLITGDEEPIEAATSERC